MKLKMRFLSAVLAVTVFLAGMPPVFSREPEKKSADPVLRDLVNETGAVPKKTAADTEASLDKSQKTGKKDHKVQPGDRLLIKIYPEDDYIKGGEMQVSSEGAITLPLIGKYQILGKTLPEAEKELSTIIDADYLVNPGVAIELKEYASKAKSRLIILGQVRKPGPYEIPPDKDRMTLLELISLAGGFTEVANIKKIKVIRNRNGQKETQSVNAESIINGSEEDLELEPDDVINVAESLF